MRSILFSVLVLSVIAFVSVTEAAIIQDQAGGSWGIGYATPVGQTFTAVDEEIVSVGFMVRHYYSPTPDASLFISLYSGIGDGGLLVADGLVAISEDHASNEAEWVDLDVTGTTLTIGNVYSLYIALGSPYNNFSVLQQQVQYGNGSPYPGAVDYTGGQAIFQGNLSAVSDMTFRVLDESQDVPDAGATATLLVSALAMAGLLHRRIR